MIDNTLYDLDAEFIFHTRVENCTFNSKVVGYYNTI